MSMQLSHLSEPHTMEVATGILSALVAVTTRLFGPDVSIAESYDPEHPQDKYVQLSVKVKMAPTDIVRAEGEWAREIARIAPRWDRLRLLILPTS
ncbi:MAG: hypothetical protein K8T91_18345 [Planctomycetes bacterium]|nr:hypothetical protein [Planctomycetota bacterium]